MFECTSDITTLEPCPPVDDLLTVFDSLDVDFVVLDVVFDVDVDDVVVDCSLGIEFFFRSIFTQHTRNGTWKREKKIENENRWFENLMTFSKRYRITRWKISVVFSNIWKIDKTKWASRGVGVSMSVCVQTWDCCVWPERSGGRVTTVDVVVVLLLSFFDATILLLPFSLRLFFVSFDTIDYFEIIYLLSLRWTRVFLVERFNVGFDSSWDLRNKFNF